MNSIWVINLWLVVRHGLVFIGGLTLLVTLARSLSLFLHLIGRLILVDRRYTLVLNLWLCIRVLLVMPRPFLLGLVANQIAMFIVLIVIVIRVVFLGGQRSKFNINKQRKSLMYKCM